MERYSTKLLSPFLWDVLVYICVYLHIFAKNSKKLHIFAYICIHLHTFVYIWQNYRLRFFEMFLYETFVRPSLLTTLLIGDLWWQHWCWFIDYDPKMAAKFLEVIHVVSKFAQPWNYINVTVAKNYKYDASIGPLLGGALDTPWHPFAFVNNFSFYFQILIQIIFWQLWFFWSFLLCPGSIYIFPRQQLGLFCIFVFTWLIWQKA